MPVPSYGTESKISYTGAHMTAVVAHDINGLERSITEVSDLIARLRVDAEIKRLIANIHRPGFTTPAEYLLLKAAVLSMQEHLAAVSALKATVIQASDAIGR